jgi:hypothetical protein
VATQLARWPDVVSKFPHLLNFIYANNGMFPEGQTRSEEAFPKNFASLVVGKTDAIDFMWKNRGEIYSLIKPEIKNYREAGSSKKEEAAFKLYLKLLRLPRLGLPKAGFATQLIIGRLGCIDSINSNILALPADIMTTDKKGATRFKTPSSSSKPTEEFLPDLTKSGVQLAEKYAKYLKNLEELSHNDISKVLWDNWCDIVAYKIKHPRTQFDVELQGGLKGGKVESDYPREYGKTNPSSEFMKNYAKNITGVDVSRQHYIPQMKENLRDMIMEELLKLLNEKTFAGKKELDKDGDGIPKWADKDDNNADVGSKSSNKKSGKVPPQFQKKKELDEMSSMSAGSVEGGFSASNKKDLQQLEEDDTIVEYLTEEEAKKNPPLGKVTRNPAGSKKKFHVYVKCGGRVKKISFGDPNLSIKRDSPERRKSFRARHKCDKPEGKNRCTARYWSCYQWRAGKKVEGE